MKNLPKKATSKNGATVRLLLILLLLQVPTAARARGAGDDAAAFKALPQAGALTDFVPEGWKILDQSRSASGRLTAVELIRKCSTKEEIEGDMPRALLMLRSKTATGPYQLIGLNTRMLECLGCYGAAGRTELIFSGDVLTVCLSSGSNSSMSGQAYKFRYQPKLRRMRLIGLESDFRTYEESQQYSVNLLTGVATLTCPVRNFKALGSRQIRRFSTPELYLEEILPTGDNQWEQDIYRSFLRQSEIKEDNVDIRGSFRSLPAAAASPEAFVPADWKIRKQVASASGRLLMLELILKSASGDDEFWKRRALLALLKKGVNSPYRAIGLNLLFLECPGCLGRDGSDDIRFAGEMPELSKTSGTGDSWSRVMFRCRFEKATGRLRVISEERSGGETAVTEEWLDYLSGKATRQEYHGPTPAGPCLTRQFTPCQVYFEDLDLVNEVVDTFALFHEPVK